MFTKIPDCFAVFFYKVMPSIAKRLGNHYLLEQIHTKQMTSTNPKSKDLIDKDVVNEMIENAIRRHNRRSTIISAILGWILIGGYSFGLFHVVQNI
ncbi:hypothetical protein DNJ73_03685 [Prochlorococcus marinus XMU1408]|uniref:Uncharacterized protein n=2 Tax=Prochlorococcus marinus TaxID=1219 RepID=A0A318R3V5_PROMR|nr:hypothetical protein [Prochlorococcus marinus str. XMU1408]PYE02860.1 hypothetical protein DNJ73_03685 [Prochlorococcus marinus XMU1408]